MERCHIERFADCVGMSIRRMESAYVLYEKCAHRIGHGALIGEDWSACETKRIATLYQLTETLFAVRIAGNKETIYCINNELRRHAIDELLP